MAVSFRMVPVLFCLPLGVAAQEMTALQEEIASGCVAGLGLGLQVCTCLAETAGADLGEGGQRMLLAMVQNDPDAVAIATQGASMEDQIAAPLMMLGGLQACVLGGPAPSDGPALPQTAVAPQTVPTDTTGASAVSEAAVGASE